MPQPQSRFDCFLTKHLAFVWCRAPFFLVHHGNFSSQASYERGYIRTERRAIIVLFLSSHGPHSCPRFQLNADSIFLSTFQRHLLSADEFSNSLSAHFHFEAGRNTPFGPRSGNVFSGRTSLSPGFYLVTQDTQRNSNNFRRTFSYGVVLPRSFHYTDLCRYLESFEPRHFGSRSDSDKLNHALISSLKRAELRALVNKLFQSLNFCSESRPRQNLNQCASALFRPPGEMLAESVGIYPLIWLGDDLFRAFCSESGYIRHLLKARGLLYLPLAMNISRSGTVVSVLSPSSRLGNHFPLLFLNTQIGSQIGADVRCFGASAPLGEEKHKAAKFSSASQLLIDVTFLAPLGTRVISPDTYSFCEGPDGLVTDSVSVQKFIRLLLDNVEDCLIEVVTGRTVSDFRSYRQSQSSLYP